MAKVAIHTALNHTTLRPHVIYDGGENRFTTWLRDREIPIIFHKGSISEAFPDAGRDIPLAAALSGAFLRVDLPAIATRLGPYAKVLYTDCDVIFRGEVTAKLDECQCRYFSVGPEFIRHDYEHMNTGVMLMNVTTLRKTLPAFQDFIVTEMDSLRKDSWDQCAYRRFYRAANGARLWDDLPAELNWKPYWGDYSSAEIIHFHGPKPYQRNHLASHYPEIQHLSGGAYKELTDLYESLLCEAG